MSVKHERDSHQDQSNVYQIRIIGALDSQWSDWFEGFSITLEEDGNTLLTGIIVDQAALHGLLKKVRDLGMPLVSINQTHFTETQSCNPKKGESKMNANVTRTHKFDVKTLLSTLWIIVVINILMADILGLFIPGTTDEITKTSASTGTAIPNLMLGGAIMTELGIVMVILSRILKPNINRWVNIIVSLITIAYVIIGGTSYPHYIFAAAIEVICLLAIIFIAWKGSHSDQPTTKDA